MQIDASVPTRGLEGVDCGTSRGLPTDELLVDFQAETEFDLLGLFQRRGRPAVPLRAPAPMPNILWLCRRPILTTRPSTKRC
jgi:predicted Zn-dependent protease with MMP-like domain